MRQTSSDTDRDTTCPVIGFAVGGQATPITRLEAGGGQIGRLAGAHALKRGPTSFGKGNPLCHPNLFHVDLSHAVGGVTPTRGSHSEFFFGAGQRPQEGGGVPWLLGLWCVGPSHMLALAYDIWNTPTRLY